MPITAETLKQYKRGDVFIETGCLHGDGVQAALDAGFARVITIELDRTNADHVRRRFAGRPVTVIDGDTCAMLPRVLESLNEPATFWLDAHPAQSTPILIELASLARHAIRTHTLLIDDRRLFGNVWMVGENEIRAAIHAINSEYVVSYADGFVSNDIIVARACVMPLARFAGNVTSQAGEDGIIAYILSRIGEGTKTAVEFGAADGKWLSNTWALEQKGWKRFLFDGDSRGNARVHKAVLTVDNIKDVFDAACVPWLVDVLSVDVGGNDLWLLSCIDRRVRLVVAEYNAALPVGQAIAIKYNPDHRWDSSSYFGASLHALYLLGCARGMRLVHVGKLNAFFVEEREAERAGLEAVPPIHEVKQYHSPVDWSREWVRVEF